MKRIGRLLLGCTLACTAGAAFAADLLIENVTLISPDLSAPLPSRHVLIRDGRIAQISEHRISLSDKTPRLDGHGKSLSFLLLDAEIEIAGSK